MVFGLGLRNLLHTEMIVTWEKCIIASGKLQTDATASPPPPPIHQLIDLQVTPGWGWER